MPVINKKRELSRERKEKKKKAIGEAESMEE